VRCGQLRLGYPSEKRPLKPEHCVFVNNIVYETDDERLLQLFEADSVECRGNILYATQGKNTGIEGMNYSKDAFRIVDPRLKERGAIYRLTPESPAINAAQITYAYVDKDMDGESRDDKGDIGADEFVPGSGAERTPLSASEVGPLAHD